MTKLLYSTPDNAVLYDAELSKTAYQLYNILVDMADRRSHRLYAYVYEIAEALHRSIRTTRRHLSTLVTLGIIEIIFRKQSHNSKMNLKSIFVIHGRHAKRYENSEYAGDYPRSTRAKMATTRTKITGYKDTRDTLEEKENLTLKKRGKP